MFNNINSESCLTWWSLQTRCWMGQTSWNTRVLLLPKWCICHISWALSLSNLLLSLLFLLAGIPICNTILIKLAWTRYFLLSTPSFQKFNFWSLMLLRPIFLTETFAIGCLAKRRQNTVKSLPFFILCLQGLSSLLTRSAFWYTKLREYYEENTPKFQVINSLQKFIYVPFTMYVLYYITSVGNMHACRYSFGICTC